MTVTEGLLPMLVVLGTFLVLSPWLNSQANWVRTLWRWFALIVLARYLGWRVLESLPEAAATLTFGYQAACLCVEAAFWYLVFGIRLRETRGLSRSAEADAQEAWWHDRKDAPLIDILIPTYNEAREVLERTLVGATHQDYPRYRVWILDDGARDWLAAWASELGVGYLRRSDNRHYKAGNLNAGLEQVRGMAEEAEFVAVVDADFVLRPRFLRRALALMYEPSTAVVQTPQHFFNPDPFQHALGGVRAIPDEQRYFFDHRQSVLDFVGYANCCGTSFLVRSSALKRIGGFPTESVSEDTLMSMKLRRLGLKTVYLNEPLSTGLNPDGLKQYLSQRARWSLGWVQIMQSAWGPLERRRGVGQYFEFFRDSVTWAFFCGYHWFAALVAIVFWLTGTYVINADLADIVYWGGPLWVENYIACWLSRGRYLPLATEATEVVTGCAVVPSTYHALKSAGERPFSVTTKGVQRDRVVVHWRILRWVLLAIALQVAGVILALAVPYSHVRTSELFGFMLFNSAQTVLTFTMVAFVCIELPNRRKNDRFESSESAKLEVDGEEVPVTVRDICTNGVLLGAAGAHLVPGDRTAVTLAGVGRVPAEVVRRSRKGDFGLALELTPAQRSAMVRKLYCADAYQRPPVAWSPWVFIWRLGKRLMGVP